MRCSSGVLVGIRCQNSSHVSALKPDQFENSEGGPGARPVYQLVCPIQVRQTGSHGAGEHEHRAGLMLLQSCLAGYPGIKVEFVSLTGQGWVPVTHADYTVFIDMLKQEAAERRRR